MEIIQILVTLQLSNKLEDTDIGYIFVKITDTGYNFWYHHFMYYISFNHLPWRFTNEKVKWQVTKTDQTSPQVNSSISSVQVKNQTCNQSICWKCPNDVGDKSPFWCVNFSHVGTDTYPRYHSNHGMEKIHCCIRWKD